MLVLVVMLVLGGCGGPAAGPTGTPIICNFTNKGRGMARTALSRPA